MIATDQAAAFDIPLAAQFVPSLETPARYAFTVVTASGPICRAQPGACDNKSSVYTLWSPPTRYPIFANHPDPRQGLTVKLPAGWRDITVRHEATGETRVVQIRIVGIGSQFHLSTSATVLTGITNPEAAHQALWNGGGLGSAPAPCLSTYGKVTSDRDVQFLWMTPVAAACAKQSAFTIPDARLVTTEFVYELRTPTPLDMSSGLWTGGYSYSSGPGQDFDFGDNFIGTSPPIVALSLTVAHQLRAVFPPGADHLALEPEGGWIAWLNGGRRPERIMRDQPFRFTSSGPVKMRLECQYSMAGNCAINNPDGHSVAVETRITLPAGIRESGGGAVSKTLLSDLTELATASDRYVADQPGLLHFEVGRADVAAMLRYPDTTYSGNVTVLWDSALSP
jgi:hypothetical protein